MPIEIVCSGCGKRGFVPDAAAGRLIRCFVCGTQMIAPSPAGEKSADPTSISKPGTKPAAPSAKPGSAAAKPASAGSAQPRPVTGVSATSGASGNRTAPPGAGTGRPAAPGSPKVASGASPGVTKPVGAGRSRTLAGLEAEAGLPSLGPDPTTKQILADFANRPPANTQWPTHSGVTPPPFPIPEPNMNPGLGLGSGSYGNRQDIAPPGYGGLMPQNSAPASMASMYGGPASATVGSHATPLVNPVVAVARKKKQTLRYVALGLGSIAAAVLGAVGASMFFSDEPNADPSGSNSPNQTTSAPVNPGGGPAPWAAGSPTPGSPSASEPTTTLWSIQPDPLTKPLDLSKLEEWKIPVPDRRPDREPLVFPSVPSPFALIGENRNGMCDRQVFSLITGKEVGRLTQVRELFRIALSPDGKTVAGFSSKYPVSVVVADAFEDRELQSIKFDREPIYLGFDPGDKVVIVDDMGRIEIYNRATGEAVGQYRDSQGIRRESVVQSAGRRYLAYAVADGSFLKVYDLNTRTIVVRQPMAPQTLCEAPAFSQDGQFLAALARTQDDDHMLQCWTLDGKVQFEHRYVKGALSAGSTISTTDQKLQWMPDGSGWFALGQTIIEKQSGQIVSRMPYGTGRPESPRRIWDLGRGLILEGLGNRELKVASLPKEMINAAMVAARNGGEAVDALLPPLKSPDASAAKTNKAETRTLWRVYPDPSPKPASGATAVGVKPIELLPESPVEKVMFSSADKATALIAHRPEGKNRRIERVNLTNGSRSGQFQIPVELEPAALSPNGELVLLMSSSRRPRVDIYKTVDGSRLIGWRPAQAGKDYEGDITFAAFLTDTRALFIHQPGNLTVWDVNDAKVVYRLEGAISGRSGLALSPGRKMLAAWNGSELRMIDLENGAIRGALSLGTGAAASATPAVAFRLNGAEVGVGLGNQVCLVDVAKGEAKTRIPIGSQNVIKKLEFSGQQYALIDNSMLLDLNSRQEIWRFAGPEYHAEEGFNERHWFASGEGSGKPRLTPMTIPPDRVTKSIQAVTDPQTKPIIQKGQKIALIIEGPLPVGAEDGWRQLRRDVSQKLSNLGCEPDDAAKIRLVFRFREELTGNTRSYSPNATTPPVPTSTTTPPASNPAGPGAAGPGASGPAQTPPPPALTNAGGGPNPEPAGDSSSSTLTRVAERKVFFEVLLDDSQGQPYPLGSDFAISALTDQFRITPNGPSDEAIRREVWVNAMRKAGAVRIPAYLARRGNEFIILPGELPWAEIASTQ